MDSKDEIDFSFPKIPYPIQVSFYFDQVESNVHFFRTFTFLERFYARTLLLPK